VIIDTGLLLLTDQPTSFLNEGVSGIFAIPEQRRGVPPSLYDCGTLNM